MDVLGIIADVLLVYKYVEKRNTFGTSPTTIHHLCFMPICIHYIRSTGKGDWPQHAFLSVFIAVSVLSVWTRVFVPRFVRKKIKYQHVVQVLE